MVLPWFAKALPLRSKRKFICKINQIFRKVFVTTLQKYLLTLTLVITPRLVYIGLEGFFLTPMIGKQKVAFSSGCVTWALFILKPMGLINLSNFGGFLVKLSPTNVTLVTILFHPFLLLFPDFSTLKTSVSDWALKTNLKFNK